MYLLSNDLTGVDNIEWCLDLNLHFFHSVVSYVLPDDYLTKSYGKQVVCEERHIVDFHGELRLPLTNETVANIV